MCFEQCLMNPEWITAIATITIAIVAWIELSKNRKTKHAEFLTDLYERFYLNDNFKSVREKTDKPKDNPFTKEDFDSDMRADKDFEQKFSDYLNFFQFIISLKKLSQLDDGEINMMFRYYLYKLKESEFIMDYLKEYKYSLLLEHLRCLKENDS